MYSLYISDSVLGRVNHLGM